MQSLKTLTISPLKIFKDTKKYKSKITVDKRELLNNILAKAKYHKSTEDNYENSVVKSFGIEAIEKDNEVINSIVFDNIEEATELIFNVNINESKEDIFENIKLKLKEKSLDTNSSFRLLFHLS